MYKCDMTTEKKHVAIYGQFDNHWSIGTVSRGIVAGLLALDAQPFCVCEEPPRDMWQYTATEEGYAALHDVEWGVADSSWPAIYIGYPPLATEAFWRHQVKIGVFITESSVVPADWGALAERCDLVCPPSTWAAHAYIHAGVKSSKTHVIHHGIHPIYQATLSSRRDYNAPRLLHVAGARDFIDRKGTPQLLLAFERFLHEVPTARLCIRTPPSPRLGGVLSTLEETTRRAITMDYHDDALAPQSMFTYYRGDPFERAWDAVIQPSMSEAFGLVPVEARAVGVPIIMTRAHGHAEHAIQQDVIIPIGLACGLPVNGIPAGIVVSVHLDDIHNALCSWYTRRVELVLEAQALANMPYAACWRWDHVLRKDCLLDCLMPQSRRRDLT